MVYFVSLALFIIMIPFNLWNWYLATSGQTAIEYWMRKTPPKSGNERQGESQQERIVDFRRSSKIKNLEYVFGTQSVWKTFLPSIRKLPLDGIDWENYINHRNM